MDRVALAYGGKAFLDSINNVELRLEGTAFSSGRSHTPDRRRPMPVITTVAIQLKEKNYRYGGDYDDRKYSGTVASVGSNWAQIINEDEVHLLFPLL
ncbi:MAG: hypothetical protein V3R73_03740, partial [Sphingomonadales bacterium]